jgi:hypothetical protein
MDPQTICLLDQDPHFHADPDLVACKFFRRAKSQGSFFKKKIITKIHTEKNDMAQLAKYVGYRQNRV